MQEMKLHFQRFEFKYFLTFQEFREIRERIRRYVLPDGFAKLSKSGFYEVVSLYYDSPKFFYYQQKMDGSRNRKKIRLRTYRVDGEQAGPLFLEIKRKFDTVILKDRFVLAQEAYDRLMRTGSFMASDFTSDSKVKSIVEEYEAERYKRSLEPKVLVCYRREPYLGKYNKNFRVTFDYHIAASESRDLFSRERGQDVLSDGVIMEIKFNGRLPRYIREIIESYNLERVAYSKYCKGAETCYVFRGLPTSRNYFFNVDKQLMTQTYEYAI